MASSGLTAPGDETGRNAPIVPRIPHEINRVMSGLGHLRQRRDGTLRLGFVSSIS
jgi:hypothetical protein